MRTLLGKPRETRKGGESGDTAYRLTQSREGWGRDTMVFCGGAFGIDKVELNRRKLKLTKGYLT